MSDGITDAYKEQQESENFQAWLMALATHLVVKTQDTADKLAGIDISVKKEVRERQLEQLQAKNKPEWCRFLLACQEENPRAFDRARGIAPFPTPYGIKLIEFSNYNKESKLWIPLFEKHGFATSGYHGSLGGYDSYAILYTEESTLREIVTTSIWLGWRTTRWSGEDTERPTSPWKKDRLPAE